GEFVGNRHNFNCYLAFTRGDADPLIRTPVVFAGFCSAMPREEYNQIFVQVPCPANGEFRGIDGVHERGEFRRFGVQRNDAYRWRPLGGEDNDVNGGGDNRVLVGIDCAHRKQMVARRGVGPFERVEDGCPWVWRAEEFDLGAANVFI